MVIISESCIDGKYDILSLLTRLKEVVTIFFRAIFLFISLFLSSISAVAHRTVKILVLAFVR